MNPRWRWRNVPVPEPFVGGLALGIPLQIILPWAPLPQAWMGHAVGWPLGMGGVLLVVLREERALEPWFGAEYAAYRGRTRRYL